MPKYYIPQYQNAPQDRPLPINPSRLPLTDLHVHVDGGTLTENTVRVLACKNNIPISEELASRIFRGDGSIQYEEGNFLDFLTVYDLVSDFIRTKEDYEYITYEYLKSCAQEGACYVELMFSPDHAKSVRQKFGESASSEQSSQWAQAVHSMTYQDWVDAIVKGITRAKKDFGIESRIVMALLRHNRYEGCQETLNEILSYRHPYVVGIDLVGDEINFPPEQFQEIFRQAKRHGLKTAIHVGEHGDATSIRSTLATIQPDRLSHGVRAIEDSALVDELVKKKIGLAICLTSNHRLGICPSIGSNPFRNLFLKGVNVSLNSDDPSFWSTSIGREYTLAEKTWKLSFYHMKYLVQNGIQMSFAPESLKAKLLAQLELYVEFSHLMIDAKDQENQKVIEMLEHYVAEPSLRNARKLVNTGCPFGSVMNLAQLHQKYVQASEAHSLSHDHVQAKFAKRETIEQGMSASVSAEEMAKAYQANSLSRRCATRRG